MKRKMIGFVCVLLLLSMNVSAFSVKQPAGVDGSELDIVIDVGILRFLEDVEAQDCFDVFVSVNVAGQVFYSDLFESVRSQDMQFSRQLSIDSDQRFVPIVFEAFFIDEDGSEVMLDLDADEGIGAVSIVFDVYTGRWSGEDFLGDISGFGRLNGCDDGSIYELQGDVELYFDISVVGCDGDGVPEWAEEVMLGTDPCVDDSLRDDDGDGVPLFWEYRFGFDPFVFEDHSVLDIDDDGLNNIEEFMTSQWGSDPFRDDLFLELDQMEFGPNGEGYLMPEQSKEMLVEPFNRRNIVFHIDDGCMGGGELIPFEKKSWITNDKQQYQDYFLHGDANNWRRGVFHWGLVMYDHRPKLMKGYAFPGESMVTGSVLEGRNCFIVSSKSIMEKSGPGWPPCTFELAFASVVMHELGHGLGVLGSVFPGCDNQKGRSPLGIGFWMYGDYVSCMNYRYCYRYMDYSDGSNGMRDFDDWSFMELARFQQPFNE